MRQIFRFNPISRFLRLSINQSIAKFHILKPPYPNLPYTENSLLLQALVACRHTAILQERDITVFSWNLVQYRSSVYTFPLHCFGIAYLIHDSPSLFTFKSNLKILLQGCLLGCPCWNVFHLVVCCYYFICLLVVCEC